MIECPIMLHQKQEERESYQVCSQEEIQGITNFHLLIKSVVKNGGGSFMLCLDLDLDLDLDL